LQGSYDILLLRSLVASRGGLLLRWLRIRSASGVTLSELKIKASNLLQQKLPHTTIKACYYSA
jgi:hypothetical protein